MRHETYVNLADRQYVKKTNIDSDRGTIYFKTKDGLPIPVASMKVSMSLYINPRTFQTYVTQGKYKNIAGEKLESVASASEDLYTRLRTVLGTSTVTEGSRAEFSDLKNKTSAYDELFKNITEKQAEQVKALNLSFLGVTKDKKRHYPGGELAPHVVGLLGFKGDDLAGRYGLEKQYQRTLARKESAYTNFFVELFSGAKKMISDDKQFEGDIFSTIEPTVQKELQKTIGTVQTQQDSELTGAIVMDPYTGEIIAMAQTPSFDPDNTKGVKDIRVYKNDMVESSHEMGSIIKPLTMAVGIDTGKVHADTIYNDEGFVKVRDRTIYNFDKKGRGNITLQEALSKSLNTGFVYISRLVGNDEMTDYFYKFGLGEKTNIDLPNESAPLTQNLKKGDVEHATASFGQGIAMTPVGTIRALAVLANGGYLVNPHVIDKIQYSIGTFKNIEPKKLEEKDKLLKQTTIDEVKSMLVYNVDNALLNGTRKNPRYSIAAKTGTAQIASESGGYLDAKNMHTFIGFFPAYKPRFIVFMYTVYPKKAQYASESLANSFLNLSDFLIQYYEIAPDR